MNILDEKKMTYLENHCSYLEKENEQLKNDKTVLELQLMGYKDNDKMSLKMLRKLLKDAIVSKQMYQNMIKDLTKKIKMANGLLLELRSLKPMYTKELDKTLKEITKTVK